MASIVASTSYCYLDCYALMVCGYHEYMHAVVSKNLSCSYHVKIICAILCCGCQERLRQERLRFWMPGCNGIFLKLPLHSQPRIATLLSSVSRLWDILHKFLSNRNRSCGQITTTTVWIYSLNIVSNFPDWLAHWQQQLTKKEWIPTENHSD